MTPKFIELKTAKIGQILIDKYVNVNIIESISKYSDTDFSFITFTNGGYAFIDKRTPEQILELINGSNEVLPTKETKTFPRKMLVHNGCNNEHTHKYEYIVIADLGEDFIFRYVCVAWDNEEYFEDGSGAFNTSSFKFAEEID